ncbi:2,4-dichlorophenol 6-monooxygenase [Colletotrichum chlorophyti]|uniref:2,4-dichlorophenol 6-monooxygenase n=1 Tax=Colletotrichum chlorophyti TaxID=708187 RepID=A0A1Q8RUA6_9PEZI|nr:2,4-dichlorophenol 6-monooxygenase [Colletotrichum chlorophyti]
MMNITHPPCYEHTFKMGYSSSIMKPEGFPKENVSADVPVLIAGGGPTGLFTAYMLSKHGDIVRSLLVEKYAERLAAPKAHALCPRTLEICRQYGLDTKAIRQLGSPRDDACWVNFLTNLSGETIGYLPYERMDAQVLESTPEMIHNIPQPEFENYLSDQLANDANVQICKGVGFVSCEQIGDRILSTVEESVTQKRWTIVSRHVIGCDGAKSQVRKSLDIESEGEDGYDTMMTIHFNADLRPVVKERVGMLHWIVDPACSGFIIAYDLGGNQVLITNFDSKKRPAEAWNEQLAHATVLAAIGQDIPVKVLSFRSWKLRRSVAKEYQRGNAFLVGDAAHSFPPTGGLGLNSGLADAHNLVYKIAAVHQGWASPEILRTYETERRPIALVASTQSIKNGKSIFSFLKAVGAAGAEDLETARQNMYRTIHDPSKQDLLAESVERQREHFDNLEIHIGYVYGDKRPPDNASLFTPKFRTGARLAHAWINSQNSAEVLIQDPIDTSYVKELSREEVAARRFSILDIVSPGTFNLIVGCRAAWTSRFNDLRRNLDEKLASRIHLWAADSDFRFSNDEHRKMYEQKGRLSQGGAILVRPDQHILACLCSEASGREMACIVLRHVSLDA